MSEPTQIKNTNHQSIQPLLIFVCLAVGVLWGAQIKKVEKDKFTQIIDIVESDYVDSSNGEYIREFYGFGLLRCSIRVVGLVYLKSNPNNLTESPR
jgi:hypothetical protein